MKNDIASVTRQYIYILEVAEELYSREISELSVLNFLPQNKYLLSTLHIVSQVSLCSACTFWKLLKDYIVETDSVIAAHHR